MATTEEEFIAKIAQRLGRAPMAAPPPRPGFRRTTPQPNPNIAGREAMADWFCREIVKIGGTAETVTGLAAATAAAAAHVAATCKLGGDVVFWDHPVALAAKDEIETVGFKPHVWPQTRELCAGAVAGITSAHVAVAETASIGLLASPQTGRLVSLLPPLHVALVPTSIMLTTVGDYFKWVGTLDRIPSAVNLISGPSRTADIELELAIGVHGPESLHVILFHD